MMTMAALAVMVQPAAVTAGLFTDALMVMHQQAVLLPLVQPAAVAVITLMAMLQTTTTVWQSPSAPQSGAAKCLIKVVHAIWRSCAEYTCVGMGAFAWIWRGASHTLAAASTFAWIHAANPRWKSNDA